MDTLLHWYNLVLSLAVPLLPNSVTSKIILLPIIITTMTKQETVDTIPTMKQQIMSFPLANEKPPSVIYNNTDKKDDDDVSYDLEYVEVIAVLLAREAVQRSMIGSNTTIEYYDEKHKHNNNNNDDDKVVMDHDDEEILKEEARNDRIMFPIG